jgi:hypothetical protein
MAELQFLAEGPAPQQRHRLPGRKGGSAVLLLTAAGILAVAYSSGRTYVSVTPASLDFGFEPVAALGPARRVTLTNQGAEPLRNPVARLITADFTIGSNGCAATLEPGQTCVVEVRFTPQAVGGRVAHLDLPPAHQQVVLSGTGFSGEQLSVNPAGVDFGEQQVLTDSQPQQVTITNQSPVNLTLEIAIQQDPNRQFAIDGDDCAALEPRQSCRIGVRFHPSAEAAATAFLTVRDGLGYSPRAVKISGTGKAAGFTHIELQPGSLTFEAQRINVPSAEQSVTIASTGNQPVQLQQAAKGGDNAQDFEVTRDGCSGIKLDPQQTCLLAIRFRPSAQGSRNAYVSIPDDSGADAPDDAHRVTLLGSGVVPTFAHAQVSPRSQSFGEQETGKPSEVRYIAVLSDGSAPLKVGATALTGAGAAGFAIGPNACSQALLGHGQTCRIGVTFRPESFGLKTATLVIRDNSPAGSESIYLEANGIPKAVAAAVVDPAELRFKTGERQSVTVASTGTASLEIGTAGIRGTGFTIGNNTCSGANLARGATCQIQVVYSSRSQQQATLSIPDNTPSGYEQVSLVGTATQPPPVAASGFTVFPGELQFPETPVRGRSQPQYANIRSNSTAPLPNLSITLSDGNFARASTDCSSNSACRLGIVFTPQSASSQRGTLLIGDGVSAPQTVLLNGTGVQSPIVSPAPGWCCYGGRIAQSSPSACEQSAGYFSFLQAQAQATCAVVRPSPKLGWCCVQGKIEQTSQDSCPRERGFFSFKEADVRKHCSANKDGGGQGGDQTGNGLGWCCANGNISQASQLNCARRRGYFNLNPSQVQRVCSPGRPTGSGKGHPTPPHIPTVPTHGKPPKPGPPPIQ